MEHRYKIQFKSISLCLFMVIAVLHVFGQGSKVQVKSKVTDTSGSPVASAAIYFNEGNKMIHSGSDGSFSLEIQAADYLRVEAEGFEPALISAMELTSGKDVVLSKALLKTGLTDQVKIPFGVTNQRNFLGAADVINARDVLKYDANQDIYQALMGRVSGNYGVSNVRGNGSALVVIDGIPRASAYDGSALSDFDMLGTLSMEEIDQIVLLKDGLSRMLYGAQANQPVLLVTTRRGIPFKRTLEVNAEQGIRTVRGDYPQYLNSADYMAYYNKALSNDGLSALYTQSDIDATRNGNDRLRYPDQEYYNSEFLKSITDFRRFSVENSGGNDRAQFYSTLIWESDGDLYKLGQGSKDRNNQFSFRGNVNYKLNDWIKMRLDALAQYGSNRVANASFWSLAGTLRPNAFPMLIPADKVVRANKAILSSAKLYNNQYVIGGTDQYRTNIYAAFDKGGYSTYQTRTASVGSGIDFDLKKITEGLKAHAFYTFDALNDFQLSYASTYKVYKPTFVGDSVNIATNYGTDNKATSQSYLDPDFYRGNSFYGTFDYSRVFAEKHSVNATAVGYWFKAKMFQVYNAMKYQHGGLRANYMYDNRIAAEFSLTYTGSGKLIDDNRYRFSPGLGVGWILSEENFLEGSKFINFLKLKANYAGIRNESGYPGFLLYKTLYTSSTGYAYNQTSGYNNSGRIFSVVGNPSLDLVNRNELNIGFESLLLNSHLSAEANFFISTLSGQVTRKSSIYPVFMGVLPYENFTKDKTTGVDLKLDYTGQAGELKYDIGFNMTYATPKMVQVDEVYDPLAPGLKYAGQPTDRILGYVAEGLFKDAADINSHVPQFGVVLNPGDVKYKDLNGDGIVDTKDQKTIGNSVPRLTYGVQVNLGYRNWSFYAMGFGQSGSERIYSDTYYWINSSSVKYSVNAKDYWTPDNAATAKYPRLSTGTSSSNSNNFRTSTFWLEKADFFSLQRIQLTYSFEVDNTWYKGVDLYVRGSDLMLVSPVKEKMLLRPGSSPSMSTFAVGCNLKF